MLLADNGHVLGIDVGYSDRRKTTGFCVLSWDNQMVDWQLENTGTDENSRIQALQNLLPGNPRGVLAVAIDGPLRPKLIVDVLTFRATESLLSRGQFQKRGKPGPTNGGNGRQLHQQATKLAHFALQQTQILPSVHIPAVHEYAVVEAFPNLFLGVLCDETNYPRPVRKRKWTASLYPELKDKLQDLLLSLLPGRKIKGNWHLKDHEGIASLICALTALCVAAQRFVAVGSDSDGYIILPPFDRWGQGSATSEAWAERELRLNIKSVARRFHRPVVYKNNEVWIQ
jgi:predicted RNase H-like nuclease